ncbi:hypothetical protein [Halorubellus sp. PRR65]|uniref:hypothetical protein n=1 Tax=Halorubellus sp. PRR65 TaxID=3098148 RepID=UPI002B260D98|nr:hypothetical protein [Halorubellus sp. PRR65]
MVRRRSVLGVGALAGASALAGCSVLGSESEGTPARFGRGATAPADPELVALDDARAGSGPRGVLESSTAAFERADGTLVVVSFHRVRSGASAFGSDWRYANVRGEHDWTAADGRVTAAETNMTSVDADSPDAAFRLAASTGDRTRSWRVVLPEPSTQGVAYRFRTTFDPATEFTDGDALATIRGGTRLTDGSVLDGTQTVDATLELVYGDTTAESDA